MMHQFEIQCGVHRGVVMARDEYSAWHKVVRDADDGFGILARFRKWLPATRGRKHRAGWTPWFYVSPRTLDMPDNP